MATEVDICNLALANLGDDATVSSISPPEGSAQASKCARFYPIARDVCLEAHPWGFATRRRELALVGSAYAGWEFQYAYPNGCLRLMQIYPPESHKKYDFFVESTESAGRVVLTDVEDAVARYIVRVTDTTKYSAQLVQAMAWLLTSYLAMPVIQDPKTRQAAYEAHLQFLEQAKQLDANQERAKDRQDEYEAAHLRARN